MGDNSSASVGALIAAVATAAAAAIAVTANGIVDAVRDDAASLGVLVGLTMIFQAFSVRVPRGGQISVSAVGMIAVAIMFGAGAAMVVAAAVGVFQWLRTRGRAHRAVFDASQLALSAGAAAVAFALVGVEGSSTRQVLGSLAAGLAYVAVNNLLLCSAIALAERRSVGSVWEERFGAARLAYLTFGPLALLWAIVGEALGALGLAMFAIAPFLLLSSIRQTIDRLRATAAPAPEAP